VLFFKPGAIGDLLHTLPALKVLKLKYPAAHVTLVVSPGLESLIQGPPVADRVLVFDKTKINKRFRDFLDFGLRLRGERYDVFIDLQPSLRSWIVRKISGAGQVLVYRKRRQDRALGKRIHAADNFLETLEPLGIAGPVEKIELPVDPRACASVDVFLKEHGLDRTRKLIALNCSVGSARPARNWFPERFAMLADRIIEEMGAGVVFVGGSEDRELVRRVMAGMRESAISAAGELTLAESAALLSRCACLVSSDTGPLHLATAVQTPVIGLFGSTDPGRTGPLGEGNVVFIKNLPCVPCEEKDCPLGTRACMAAISVDEVFEAVQNI